MTPKSPVLRGVVGALLLLHLGLYLAQLMGETWHFPVGFYQNGPLARGADFWDFYNAGTELRWDHSLYANPLYNKPPLLAVLCAPLSLVPYSSALVLWQVGTMLAVAGTLAALARSRGARGVGRWLVLATAVSYPFAFLVERGNADGYSLGAALLGAVALAGSKGTSRTVLGGALLGLAVALKPNTAVFLPVVLLVPSLRGAATAAVATVGATIAFYAVTPASTAEFWQALTARLENPLVLTENGSLARAVWFLDDPEVVDGLISARTAGSCGFLLFAGLICGGVAWRVAVRRERVSAVEGALLVMPLAQAVPQTTYLYGYVYMGALLLVYAAQRSKVVAGVGALGVLLALAPIEALTKATDWVLTLHTLPSWGLVLMLGANACVAWSRATTDF